MNLPFKSNKKSTTFCKGVPNSQNPKLRHPVDAMVLKLGRFSVQYRQLSGQECLLVPLWW